MPSNNNNTCNIHFYNAVGRNFRGDGITGHVTVWYGPDQKCCVGSLFYVHFLFTPITCM